LDIANTPVTVLGTIELTEATHITGLSNITDNFVLNLLQPPYKVSWDLSIPSVNVNGAHSLDLVLDLGSSHTLKGAGNLTASVNNVFVHVLVTLRVPLFGTIGVAALELDLGFSGLALDGGDEVHLDDTPVNWESQADNIQTWFDTFWTNNDEVKGLIVEAVRCSVDHVINSCTLPGLIGGDCLKVEISPACLAPLFPEPEPTEEPATSIATGEPGSSPTTEGPSPTTGGPSPTTGGPSPTTEGPSPTTGGPSPTTGSGSTTGSPDTTPEDTTGSGFRFASNVFLLPLVGLVFSIIR